MLYYNIIEKNNNETDSSVLYEEAAILPGRGVATRWRSWRHAMLSTATSSVPRFIEVPVLTPGSPICEFAGKKVSWRDK